MTQASNFGIHVPIPHVHQHSKRFRLAEKVCLANDDWCGPASNPWVLWRTHHAGGQGSTRSASPHSSLGRIEEILQLTGGANELLGKADWAVLRVCNVGSEHPHYGMPRVALSQQYIVTPVSVRRVFNPLHLFLHSNLYLV